MSFFKKSQIKTIIYSLTIIILSLTIQKTNQKQISEEILSKDRLENRVKVFNDWYFKLNPTSKVEAKLGSNGKINLISKTDLKTEEAYLVINKNLTLHSQLIYETPLGAFVRNLEAKYGFDDYLNIVFFLLHEMVNPSSPWKPYLDILPRQPESIAFDYWRRKGPIEEELLNTPVLKKIVDYKLLTERRAQSMQSLVLNHTETFNPECFSQLNLEWACFILDSRMIYIDYEAFLIPMLDLVQPKEWVKNPSRVLKLRFEENGSSEVKAITDFAKVQEIFENIGYNSDNYLLYKGLVLQNNFHDCYSLAASFNDKAEDGLKEIRKAVFSRYFLFDSNVSDLIEECISTKDPFSRRLLFFYYISMLDEIELEKEDIKRFGLEGDKIVLEYVRNALQSLLNLYPTKLETDIEKIQKENIDVDRKLAIAYLIEQKKYLVKLIEIYDNEINKLIKEDTL